MTLNEKDLAHPAYTHYVIRDVVNMRKKPGKNVACYETNVMCRLYQRFELHF